MPETLTHKERTRARILDEAAKAMREQGHAGIGVAKLMQRAGLTHGGFYAHFKDRDDPKMRPHPLLTWQDSVPRFTPPPDAAWAGSPTPSAAHRAMHERSFFIARSGVSGPCNKRLKL